MNKQDPDTRRSGDNADELLAARRYWILQLVRFGALGIVILGVVIMARDPSGEAYGGALLVAAGAFLFFFAPRTLARRWKSEE
ncbi:hypothetical protein GRI38_01030 [Altererythrobacter aurantiacus]|uniref:Uncharacterized protein n=1 Tax=Parapontixanthobacter aurantiacus TaxID=1463599 RepID=A0A844ZBQ2_9SPHN|nr:hypothetical protein [Parapontixanthobacter aurantiacus]MXO84616.1 hypothetical protein [Parapontixanthobacter aurantiacus]